MSEFALPETRYALSGEVNIAYQTMGYGPLDIILVPGFMRISSLCINDGTVNVTHGVQRAHLLIEFDDFCRFGTGMCNSAARSSRSLLRNSVSWRSNFAISF